MDGSNDSTLLVNSATLSNINPRDIRKLMHTPAKGKSTSSLTKKATFKSEINVNGKTCREIGKHIIYYLSKKSFF